MAKNKGFFSRLFSSPVEYEEFSEEEINVIDEFLEEYGITHDDLVDISLAIKQPKNHALNVLNMDVDDYHEFIKWKNSSLTERIKSCFTKVTNMTHFCALQYALKDEESKYGEPSIKGENWKYTPADVHMKEAKQCLDFLVEKQIVDTPTIARICVRLYYALFVHVFNVAKRSYTVAKEALENAPKLEIPGVNTLSIDPPTPPTELPTLD